MTPLIIIIVLVIILIPVLLYNNLVRKKNAVENSFFSIDVMLKKRYDLIPQLVEAVKGYMIHERDLLSSLTALRQKAMENNLPANEKVRLANQVNNILQQMKASENFLRLQGAINEAEEQLAASRRFYNAAVNDYHNAIETFPSSLVASLAGMSKEEYFTIPDSEKGVPALNI